MTAKALIGWTAVVALVSGFCVLTALLDCRHLAVTDTGPTAKAIGQTSVACTCLSNVPVAALAAAP